MVAKALLDLGPAPGGVDALAEAQLLWPALCEAAVLCPTALAVRKGQRVNKSKDI